MLPDYDIVRHNLSVIVIAAVALLLIGFSQTAGDARAFATRHRYRIDVDQESVAQGMANVGAGVFQGMPVSTSLSASSLNESAGARTPVASLVTGGLVLATLIVLAPLFSELPKAVLAAIIIDAVVFGMIDIPELRRLYRVTRFDFWIAVAAILGVLSAGVLAGVVIGVVLSLGWLIYVATQPSMPLLGREPDTQVFRDIQENPDDQTFEGIVVLRLDGGLFFATAEALENRVRELVDDEVRALVLDLEGVNFVDSQGSAKLAEIHEFLAADDVGFRIARAKPQVLAVLQADGVDRPDRRRPHPRQRPPRRRGRAHRHRGWGVADLEVLGARRVRPALPPSYLASFHTIAAPFRLPRRQVTTPITTSPATAKIPSERTSDFNLTSSSLSCCRSAAISARMSSAVRSDMALQCPDSSLRLFDRQRRLRRYGLAGETHRQESKDRGDEQDDQRNDE